MTGHKIFRVYMNVLMISQIILYLFQYVKGLLNKNTLPYDYY